MINIDDYNSWLMDNEDFLVMLEKNNSAIYERLDDVIKVVSYIEALYVAQKKVDEDMEIIFDVGFSYLFETIEEVKLYFKTYLNNDMLLLNKYSYVINYILYLDDLKASLIEKDLLNDEIKTVFSNIFMKLENILKERKPFKLEILDNFNSELDMYLSSFEVMTLLEVFSRISEELSL